MPKLYEITGEILGAIELYNQTEDDERLASIEDALNALQVDFNQKALAVAKYIKNESGDVDAIKAEIERLSKLKKSREGLVNRLNDYILSQMLATNTTEIDGGTMKLRVRKNPPSVDVLNEDKVPDIYKRTKTIVEVDKGAIKDAWKSGIGVDGTEVKQGSRLEIK